MRRILLAAMAAFAAAIPAAAQTDFTVFFALGSARISPEGETVIDQAAAAWRETGEVSVSVVGHTDTTGSAEYNEALSQRRAEAVAGELSTRGVPRDLLVLAWRGETELAVQTADNVAEPRNRRVETTLAEPAPEPAPMPAPVPPAPEPARLLVGVGPYLAWNNQKPDEESIMLGGNLTLSYFVTRNIAISGEQAGFYNFHSNDEGWGGRSVVGADYHFSAFGQASDWNPWVGANVGWTYIGGLGTGGFTAGPEIGVRYGVYSARLAYDFIEDRDAYEGVVALTLGYDFAF